MSGDRAASAGSPLYPMPWCAVPTNWPNSIGCRGAIWRSGMYPRCCSNRVPPTSPTQPGAAGCRRPTPWRYRCRGPRGRSICWSAQPPGLAVARAG